MAELKVCPFCGGKAEIVEYSDGSGHVECASCGFEALGMFSWGGEKSRKAEAIAAWNRRADDAELAQLARESVKRELKLAKLEAEVARWAQAEADGLLLALPCKVGDTVYWLSYFGGGILSGEVLVIKLSGFGIDLEILRGDVVIKREYEKTFLAREAAEAALEGAGGGDG